MKSWCYTIWVILCFIIVSCEKDYFSHPQKVLVVEGWIDAGDFPIVMVTTSAIVSNKEQQLNSVNEYILKWAKVTISDGNELVTLTGKVDTSYTPPYIFTTGKMKGVPGKTYQLTVTYDDLYAEAETTIPEPIKIDSFIVTPIEKDSLYQLNAIFNDNTKENNFYKFFVQLKGKDNTLLPAFLGTINDEVLGKCTEATIYQPLRLLGGEYSPFFCGNDTITVKFSHMNREAFQFWKTYDELQSFSGIMFFPVTSNLPSNIRGGVGYWFGYGSTIYNINLGSYIGTP